MLDLSAVHLDELATALADHGADTTWTVNRTTGAVEFWASHLDDDLDEPDSPDLVVVEPLPSYVWYQDMADFAESLADERVARRLGRALQGRGAFRRFGDVLHRDHPELLPAWNALRGARARQRAVEWLVDHGLVDEAAAERHLDQADPGRGGPHADVVRLELALLRPEVRRNPDRAGALLDPDFIEIGASGWRWTRAEMLASLAEEPADGPPIIAEDVETVDVADGVVLVRWVGVRDGRRARRSSLWRRTGQGWRMLFHQGTPSDRPRVDDS